ncbi:hypothetical protein SFUMM280S_02133 [Streptomyces fumanus]
MLGQPRVGLGVALDGYRDRCGRGGPWSGIRCSSPDGIPGHRPGRQPALSAGDRAAWPRSHAGRGEAGAAGVLAVTRGVTRRRAGRSGPTRRSRAARGLGLGGPGVARADGVHQPGAAPDARVRVSGLRAHVLATASPRGHLAAIRVHRAPTAALLGGQDQGRVRWLVASVGRELPPCSAGAQASYAAHQQRVELLEVGFAARRSRGQPGSRGIDLQRGAQPGDVPGIGAGDDRRCITPASSAGGHHRACQVPLGRYVAAGGGAPRRRGSSPRPTPRTLPEPSPELFDGGLGTGSGIAGSGNP